MNNKIRGGLLAAALIGTPLTAVLVDSTPAYATVVDDATLAAPGFYNGTGNPSNNFIIDTTGSAAGSIETGLRARYRSGSNVVPAGNVYSFPTGGTSPYGIWNYDWSVNLGTSGLHISDVIDHTTLTVTNVGTGAMGTINPFTHWTDNASYANGPVVYQNGLGNAYTTTLLGEQNSENLGFGDSPLMPGFNNMADGTYGFLLNVRDNSGILLSSVDMKAVVGNGGASPVPEPTSFLLLGAGLTGFAAVRWKKGGQHSNLAA